MMQVIEINNLFFSYNGTSVLEDINISIKRGEFVGIFGPNGGGKTTLLKLIMGFLKPNKGEILVFNHPPKSSRTKIGYVPQFSRYDKQFPISVLELVMMGCLSQLRWWGGYPAEVRQKALKVLGEVGLSDLKDRSFGTLSGGQAQRALIARALIDDPEILLLDEPTASVDPSAEKEIYGLLQNLKGKNMTIIMVTHDLQAIVAQSTRLLCVQRHIQEYSNKEICEHFNLGLYHPRSFGQSTGSHDRNP